MAEPDDGGKRMPLKGKRRPTENQPTRTTATATTPRPKPVAPMPKQAVGVPMAGQSYAKRQADEARRAKGLEPPPPPAPRPRPKPSVMAEDLEEDFDLEEEYEEDLIKDEANMAHIPDGPWPNR